MITDRGLSFLSLGLLDRIPIPVCRLPPLHPIPRPTAGDTYPRIAHLR